MPPTSTDLIPDITIGAVEQIPSRRDAKDLIKLAFKTALPSHRFPAKEIADEIGAAQSTVEGWRKPEGMMSADLLVIMQVRYPRFDAELRRLFRLRQELSPDFQRELAQLLRRVL